MAQHIDDMLSGVDLFAALPKRQLRRLVSGGREVEHTDGREVIGEGRQALGFHLILEGSAAVTTGGAPRRVLGPGDYFGEISLIDGRPRSASVVAMGDLRTFVINATAFQPLLEEPQIARRLLLVLCERLRAAEAVTTSTTSQTT